MVGLLVATLVIAVGSAIYALSQSSTAATNDSDMSPASLDSFNLTTAEEGKVVPLIFGTVRTNGNFLYYGGLTSVPEYDEVESGGKGGGSKSSKVLQGYDYYLDMWEGICRGPATIIGVYVDSDYYTWADFLELHPATFNDGTGAFYPSEAGEYASALPGICHIWFSQYSIGMNVTSAPTLHFVMKSETTTPVNYTTLDSGVNPAAIIYALLVEAGVSNFNLSSFNSAALYWKNKGYGMNISFSDQKEAKEHIKTVLSYVNGYLFEDEDGNYTLKAFDPSEASQASITDEDVISVTLSRSTWEDSPNVFKAKFIDSETDFTKRTAVATNTASVEMLGREINSSIDLTCFNTLSVASLRAWEVMKRESYPKAKLAVELPLSFASYNQGDILTFSLSQFGIENLDCVIDEKEINERDKGTVKFTVIEVPERVYDDAYTSPASGPQWVLPDYTPTPLTHTRLFQLPKNPMTGNNPAILVLASREKGVEDGLSVYFSTTGTDYVGLEVVNNWCQYGTLVDDLFISKYETTSEDEGFTFTPYLDDPTFSSLSRTDLFAKNRFAIIEDEVIKFQNVILNDDGTVTLTGLIRGVFNTSIVEHTPGAAVWLTKISDGILQGTQAKNGYYKLLPSIGGNTPLLSNVAVIHFTETLNKAQKPYPVGGVSAVRENGILTISWFPSNLNTGGAGLDSEANTLPIENFEFTGTFRVYNNVYGTNAHFDETVSTLSYTPPENHLVQNETIYVEPIYAGLTGTSSSVTVKSDDGTYN